MIRVLLIDAERSLHQGLQMRLDPEPDIRLIGLADTLQAGLRLVASAAPDIVLLDPDGLGPDPALTLRDVLHATSKARVVVLSLGDGADTRKRLLAAGASAFISKHDGSEPLADALRRVASSPRPL